MWDAMYHFRTPPDQTYDLHREPIDYDQLQVWTEVYPTQQLTDEQWCWIATFNKENAVFAGHVLRGDQRHYGEGIVFYFLWQCFTAEVILLMTPVSFMLMLLYNIVQPTHPSLLCCVGDTLYMKGLIHILVFQTIWDKISIQLLMSCNSRTENKAKDITMWFLFPFSFVSKYANIAFHAVAIRWAGSV